MKKVSQEIDTYKKKLMVKKDELEAAEKGDALDRAQGALGLNITVPKLKSHQESIETITKTILKRSNLTEDRAKSLAPIVRQLQGRLDHIDYKEKDAEMTQQELEKREKKVESSPLHSIGDKEAKRSQKLMKYLKKKTKRAFLKRQAQWKNEKKALNDAIDAIYAGKVDK